MGPNCRPFRPCHSLLTSQHPDFHSFTPPSGSSHGHQILAILESCSSSALTPGHHASWCPPPLLSKYSSLATTHTPWSAPPRSMPVPLSHSYTSFSSLSFFTLLRSLSGALDTPHSLLISRQPHLFPHLCQCSPNWYVQPRCPLQNKIPHCLLDFPFGSTADTVTSAILTFTHHLYTFFSLLVYSSSRGCHYILFSCPSPKSGT